MPTPLSSPTLRTEPDPNRLSCWCRGWGYFLNSAKEPPEATLCGNCHAANERLSSPPNVERAGAAMMRTSAGRRLTNDYTDDEIREFALAALSSTQDTASQDSDISEALTDCQTHRRAWLDALQIARDAAEVSPPDMDDKAYWQHEIDVFSRTFNALAAISSTDTGDIRAAMEGADGVSSGPDGSGSMRVVVSGFPPGDELKLFNLLSRALNQPGSER